MCKRTLSLPLRLRVLQVGHGGAVPFGALLFLQHSQGSALAPSHASFPLVQHFHGYLMVGVLALGVPAERVALGEARVAELALVGLLPGVDPLVPLELAGLPEAFGTDGAHKVPLARVDVLVSLKEREETETLLRDLGNISIRTRGGPLQVLVASDAPSYAAIGRGCQGPDT